MPDILAMGELLIDFVPTVTGVNLIEAEAFKKAPGGAPANVAAGLARLGVSSGFIGKVGDEAFGHFLRKTLNDLGVDTSALRFSSQARTALAFVSLRSDGEREFLFYRHPSADMLYTPEEVDTAYICSAKVFHFGSISLITEPSRSATLFAVQTAEAGGVLISYDPNLRLNLWPSPEAAREGMRSGWNLADVIKASDEELFFLSGEDDQDRAVRYLWHPGLRLLVITQGKDGCTYYTPSIQKHIPSFAVNPVDTTGAGDGFMAGLLKGLLENPHADEDESRLDEICRYANAVGALTTCERGAIPALPTHRQVVAFLGRQ
jgi:fructokinase